MGRTWVLDTETKGTGAQMVPLDTVTRQPEAGDKPLFVPRKRRPAPPAEPAPRPPRRFRVVDIASRQVLADGTDARTTLELLGGIRSSVDVNVSVWEPATETWRLLTLRERRMLWGHRHDHRAEARAPRVNTLAVMAYSTEEARVQLLDDLAHAIDEIGVALAALGAAYELLDERTADQLEEELFRPVQVAYGRAQRTHGGFAERHGLPGRKFEPSTAGRVSQGAKSFLDTAAEAVGETEHLLAEIQDSMMPVEVGDALLRAGLAEIRELVGPLPARAHELERIIGR